MDKSFMIFVAIGMGFLYFVITFIGDIQEEDEAYRNDSYTQEAKYDKYKTVDSIGQDMLDVTGADVKTQVDAWNNSKLKNEFVAIFPYFIDMKDFINGRIIGKELQNKLNALVDHIEDKTISGTMTSEQAKRELDSFK